MKKFEYDIKLNDDGRPYIHLEDNGDLSADDRFVCVEITKYMIFELINNNKNEFPDDFIKDLSIAGDMIKGISDKLAKLIKGQMDTLDDVNDLLDIE